MDRGLRSTSCVKDFLFVCSVPVQSQYLFGGRTHFLASFIPIMHSDSTSIVRDPNIHTY